MILVTGDTHGDFERLIFDRDLGISSDDYLIVCGDFGGIWSDSDRERQRNALLSRRFPCPLLWVDGNHENYDALSEYSVTEWCGGKVQIIEKNTSISCADRSIRLKGRRSSPLAGQHRTISIPAY